MFDALVASRLRRLTVLAAIVAALAVMVPLVAQEHYPADKATVTGSRVEVVAPGESVTLLETQMRTSSTGDLVMQVTAECALVTDLTTVGNDTAEAVGTVRVWVE